MKELINTLKNPSVEYRPIPFWSWNDKLDTDFLRWQIRQMHNSGIGGYFMHARGGLQTEYMSENWMECIEASVDEGKKLGMSAWCYDEEGWPSGFGGGVVTAMGERFYVRWLEMEVITEDNKNNHDDILGRFEVDGQKVLIRQMYNPYYVDILNEEAVKAFIECTHERYYARFENEFGHGIKGFFTDEPQFAQEKIPWSYILPQKFSEKYGYDILENLIALFTECEGYEKVRYDFWNLINELYVSSFAKQIYEWCEDNNCKLTGHAMGEDNLYTQMCSTAGCMPFYEYLHMPGIDWLGRQINSPVIPKQAGSVAAQLGKKHVLSETFGLCGWDVSFEELKWIAEWQYVNGVNLMCQHLEGYTLRGFRKRDYPPSLFYQQPWWEEYRSFNDYLSRLGMLLSSGKSGARVLLLHPIKSAWIAYNGKNNEILEKLDRHFRETTEVLSGMHIEHHYGDETLINKYGRVEGTEFIIGQCSYKVIVLPSMITIDKSTAILLEKFINNGGTVISTGDFPILCEGLPALCENAPDKILMSLKQKIICINLHDSMLYKTFRGCSIPQIRLSGNEGEIQSIHIHVRDLGNAQLYFLVNLDRKKNYDAHISITGRGSVKRLVIEEAVTEDLEYYWDEGDTKLSLSFMPMQSYMLVFEKDEDMGKVENKAKNIPENISGSEKIYFKSCGQWKIEEAGFNALTLDYCSYSIDGGKWMGPVPVIKLMDILLNMRKSCDITLKFCFEINMDMKKNKEMFLVVERAEEFELIVNDIPVLYQEQGWWRDSSFKKVNIKPYVRNGYNHVILRRKFFQSQKVYDVLFGENVLETELNRLTYDVELESIYVIGDFGVSSKSGFIRNDRRALYTEGPFVITDKPDIVEEGDLTQQGFCFFSGSVILSKIIDVEEKYGKRYIIDIGKPDSAAAKVYVNDRQAGVILWAPYAIDITDYLDNGQNKIAIQLFSGNRNLLGPHHHIHGESYMVGPASFTDRAGWMEYEAPCSKIKPGDNIWKEGYSFVRFGLRGKYYC